MKKLSFAAGMLTMALIVGLGFSALAATGQVSFNASALTLNGTQVSAKGENYTLANGQSVPASITYTDEKGGGTTYLPVRRISELLGVETGWDGAAGAVTVKGEVKAPETTTPPADYSTWSTEDEAAYQEFKGLWEITFNGKDNVPTTFQPSRDSSKRNVYTATMKQGVTLPRDYDNVELTAFGVHLYKDLGIVSDEVLQLVFPKPIGHVLTDGIAAYVSLR